MPTLKSLIYRHPTHRKFAERWKALSRLAAGGCEIDADFKRELLINPDGVEKEIATNRAKFAPYDPVIGGILMKLTSQLMAEHGAYEGDDDQFWADTFFPSGAVFNDDGVTRRESFHSLLSHATFKALVQGCMVAHVDRGEADQEPYIILRDRWDLWDWKGDNDGLVYAKLHSFKYEKPSWDADPVRQHEFTIYQRDERGRITASIYTIRHAKDEQTRGAMMPFGDDDLDKMNETDAIITAESEDVDLFHTTGGLYRFPVVIRNIEKPLWISDQLYDQTISLFNHTAGGEWALFQTNYGMPVFTGVENPHEEGNNNPARTVRHGNGYWMELPEGMDVKWLVRPGGDIELSLNYQEKIKTKMMELVYKIAETAANAYAMRMQSGESKREQRRDLDILLEVYGEDVRGFAKGILDVAAVARNTNTEWEVKGFTDYHTSGLMESLESFLAVDKAGLQSPTLTRETRKAIAAKAAADLNLPEPVLATINEELDADPTFILPEWMPGFLGELGRYSLIAPEDIYKILQLAGGIPDEMSIEEMLANLGMTGEEPQTNNPVLAEGI